MYTTDTYGDETTDFNDAKSRYGENSAVSRKQIALRLGFKELGRNLGDSKDGNMERNSKRLPSR